MINLENFQRDCYLTWVAKEWSDQVNFAEQIALVHSELSEALEEYRNNGLDETKFMYRGENDNDKPLGIASELADVIIRTLNLCSHYKIPIKSALICKAAFNNGRTFRHGGKLC